jgi:NADH dehydrogenase
VTSHRPSIVIVGGGFGGLRAARALRRAPVQVTLVDRRNHRVSAAAPQWPPPAYPPRDRGAPADDLRRQATWQFSAEAGRRPRRVVVLGDGEMGYDY